MQVPYDILNPGSGVAQQTGGVQGLNVNINPNQFGAQVGQSIDKLGQQGEDSAAKIGEANLHYQQIQNATDALNQTTMAAARISDIEADFKQKSGADAAAALPEYRDKIQAIQDGAASQFSGQAKVTLLQDLKPYVDKTIIGMGNHAGEQTHQAAVGAFQASMASEQSLVTSRIAQGEAPSPEMFDGIVNRALGSAHLMGWSKEQADAYVQTAIGDSLHNAVVTSVGSADPNSYNRSGAAQAVFQQVIHMKVPGTENPDDPNSGLPLMGAKHVGEIEQFLQNVKTTDDNRKIQAEQVAMAAQTKADNAALATTYRAVKNVQTSLAAGITPNETAMSSLPTPAQIDVYKRTNPMLAADLQDAIQEAHVGVAATASMEKATPTQMAAAIANVRSQSPDSVGGAAYQAKLLTAMEKSAATVMKNRAADPAGTVMFHDAELYDQFNSAQNAAMSAKTPDEMKAASDGLNSIADHVIAAQQNYGLAPLDQHVLPVAQAAQTARQIESGSLSLTTLRSAWGDRFPNVLRDLTTIGKLDPQMAVVAQLPQKEGDMLRQAIVDHDLPKKVEQQFGEKLVKTELSSVQNSAFNGPLSNYLRSQAASGVPVDVRNSTVDAIQKLTLANLAAGKGSGSGQLAIDSFTKQFSEIPVSGRPWVPAAYSDSIKQNADSAISTIRDHPEMIKAPAGMDQRLFAHGAAANGEWVNMPDKGGVFLTYLGRPVQSQSGLPVGFMYSDSPRPTSRSSSYFSPDAYEGAIPADIAQQPVYLPTLGGK